MGGIMERFRRVAFGCVAVFFVSACVPETGIGAALGSANASKGTASSQSTPNSPMQTNAPLCSVALHGWLRGKPATATGDVPEPKRIIPQDAMITMDHNPSRTNFDLDDAGMIRRVWCG